MATKFIAPPLCLVSPWKLVFFCDWFNPPHMLIKQFPHTQQVICVTCKSWLPGLNIGIVQSGVIRCSHRRIPWDWSTVCDMAVKTLTDCLTNTLSCMHVDTQACATTCLWTHTYAHKITVTDCFTNSTGLTDTYSPGYPLSSLLYKDATILRCNFSPFSKWFYLLIWQKCLCVTISLQHEEQNVYKDINLLFKKHHKSRITSICLHAF